MCTEDARLSINAYGRKLRHFHFGCINDDIRADILC